MKKLLLMALCLAPALFAAGTCSVTGPLPIGTSLSFVATVSCTADASTGSFPAVSIAGLLGTAPQLQGWYVASAQVTPGSPAPTAGYGLTITNAQSADQLGGAAASLSASATQAFSAITPTPIAGVLSVNLTGNSVASAQTVVRVYFAQSVPAAGLGSNTYWGTQAIGTTCPAGAPLGSLCTAATFIPIRTVATATYAVVLTDNVIACNAVSAGITFTLPTAIGLTGKVFLFKKTDSSLNTCTCVGTAGQTFDGDPSLVITTQWSSALIISNGANWLLIG